MRRHRETGFLEGRFPGLGGHHFGENQWRFRMFISMTVLIVIGFLVVYGIVQLA